jgi:hypothetical protein
MDYYYVNKNSQLNGDHEVHKSNCIYLPSELNRLGLGYFSNCQDAVREAKKYYVQCNGCYYCCPSCHTS